MSSQFGNKIRTLREEQNLLLRQVASILEMDTAQLSKIERGERQAKKETVLKNMRNKYKGNNAQVNSNISSIPNKGPIAPKRCLWILFN